MMTHDVHCRKNKMHFLYLYLPLLPLWILLLCKSDSTWAPFQSDQVRDICSHMTAEEKNRVRNRGALCGVILAVCFAVIWFFGIVIGVWLFNSPLTGMIVILPLTLILMGISVWKVKPLTDQYHKDFFASTQWSKDQGLTPDKIKLRRS